MRFDQLIIIIELKNFGNAYPAGTRHTVATSSAWDAFFRLEGFPDLGDQVPLFLRLRLLVVFRKPHTAQAEPGHFEPPFCRIDYKSLLPLPFFCLEWHRIKLNLTILFAHFSMGHEQLMLLFYLVECLNSMHDFKLHGRFCCKIWRD
jgi:hypothetical protein